jgi:hypothetical protein
MKFFKDGISMNEAKVSAIILTLFVFVGYAGYQLFTTHKISDNILSFISTQILVIGGVNAFNHYVNNKQSE